MATKKYGPKASEKVEKAMHDMKRGQLRSGRSGKKVTNPKQAVAIGLSEARAEGGKVPDAPAKKATTKSAPVARRSSPSKGRGPSKARATTGTGAKSKPRSGAAGARKNGASAKRTTSPKKRATAKKRTSTASSRPRRAT